MARMAQHQVPEGMVANVPWGQPLNRWADHMIVRGWQNVAAESAFFPRLFVSLNQEATSRGITEAQLVTA